MARPTIDSLLRLLCSKDNEKDDSRNKVFTEKETHQLHTVQYLLFSAGTASAVQHEPGPCSKAEVRWCIPSSSETAETTPAGLEILVLHQR